MAITANTGSNSWNTNAAWVGSVQPTAADDVIIPNTAVVTIPAATTALGRSLTVQAGGTIAFALATSTLTLGDGTAGAGNVALSISGTATVTLTGIGTINFVSTSATQQTITSGGKTLPILVFNGAGGSWIHSDNWAMGTSILTVSTGTWSSGGKNCTAMGGLTSTSGNTRTVDVSGSTMTCSINGGGGPNFGAATSAGLTYIDNASTVWTISTSNSGASFGVNLTYLGTVTLTYGNGSGAVTATGCTFNILNFTGGGNQARYFMASNITATTLTITGASSTSVIACISTIAGTTRTFTVTNAPTLRDVIFEDIAMSGSGTPYATTRTGNGGGNSGMTFTSPRTLYWVNNGTTAYASTSTWSTADGGASGQTPPMPQDTINITSNSITSGSKTMTIGWQGIPTLDFSNVLNNPAVAFTNTNGADTFYGNITLKAGMTSTGTVSFAMRGSQVDQTLDLKGITMGTNSITAFNKNTRKVSLLSDAVWGGSINFIPSGDTSASATMGTFDANGFNLTATTITSSGTTVRTIIMGSGIWTITSNNGTIWNMVTSTNLTFTPGNPVVSNYSGSTGTRTITPGTLQANAPSFNITAGTDIVAMNSTDFGSLDFTGFSGTFNNNTRNIYGSTYKLSSTMNCTDSTGTMTFKATSGTTTITSNTVAINSVVVIDGVGGTFKLADAMVLNAITSTRSLTVTNGTFDANDQDVTMGSFASSNSNTRTIKQGNGQWTISTNNTTVWTTSTNTNLTYIRGTKPIKFTYSGSTGTRTLSSAVSQGEGSLPSFWISAGTDVIAGTFSTLDLDFTGFTGSWTKPSHTVFGNFTLGPGMTIADSVNTTTMAATSGTKTITTNRVFANFGLTINGVGGTFNLMDTWKNLDSSHRGWIISGGTLNTNDNEIWTDTFTATSTTQACVINAGKSKIYCNNDSITNTFDFRDVANNTYNFSDSIWIRRGFTSVSVRALNVSLGSNFIWGSFYCSNGTTSTIFTIQQQIMSIGDVYYRGPGSGSNTLRFNGSVNFTIRGDLDIRGASGATVNLTTSSGTPTLVKSDGYAVCDYLNITNVNVTGGAMWFAGKNSTVTTSTGWIGQTSRRRTGNRTINASQRSRKDNRTRLTRTALYA